MPVLLLSIVILLAPKVFKFNSNVPRKKIILIQATVIEMMVGLTLSQSLSFGPVPLLLSLMIGAILLSISLRIKAETFSENVES